MDKQAIKQRLLEAIEPEEGCWVWQKTPHKRGYGRIKVAGRSLWVHRVAYEVLKERRIPVGLTVDHTCFNKLCINPDHLEAVTLEENGRRWLKKYAEDNPRFPCGHERYGGGVLVYRDGKYRSGSPKKQRRCGVCFKEYLREYHKIYKKDLLSN